MSSSEEKTLEEDFETFSKAQDWSKILPKPWNPNVTFEEFFIVKRYDDEGSHWLFYKREDLKAKRLGTAATLKYPIKCNCFLRGVDLTSYYCSQYKNLDFLNWAKRVYPELKETGVDLWIKVSLKEQEKMKAQFIETTKFIFC
jgi:hypothetical protein